MKPSDDQNYVGNLAIVVMSCSGELWNIKRNDACAWY